MVEPPPILRDLLNNKSHKTIFNEIYRLYLKNKTNDEIINLSIEIHNFIKKIRAKTAQKLDNKSLIIAEVEKDKYNVSIYDDKNDSISSIQTLKLENLIDLQILAPPNLEDFPKDYELYLRWLNRRNPKLNETELLGHIIWNYYEQHKRKII